MTFNGTFLSNNRVPSNKGTPTVNILDCKFVKIYLLIIKKHSENFVKITTFCWDRLFQKVHTLVWRLSNFLKLN